MLSLVWDLVRDRAVASADYVQTAYEQHLLVVSLGLWYEALFSLGVVMFVGARFGSRGEQSKSCPHDVTRSWPNLGWTQTNQNTVAPSDVELLAHQQNPK